MMVKRFYELLHNKMVTVRTSDYEERSCDDGSDYVLSDTFVAPPVLFSKSSDC